MIKAVWFDVGGTLHTQRPTPENDAAYAEEVFAFLKKHRIDTAPTPMELLEHINTGARAYKDFCEVELLELPNDIIWQKYILADYDIPAERLRGLGEELSYMYDRRRKMIERRAGLLQTLDALKNDGYRLGIISNIMSRTFVPRILQEYGIADYFEYCVLSSVSGKRKPRRELFDEALEHMGLNAHQAAYVGDTISRDVRGVRNAGWEVMIQIENPLIMAKDQKYLDCGVRADYRITSLTEIPDILRARKE